MLEPFHHHRRDGLLLFAAHRRLPAAVAFTAHTRQRRLRHAAFDARSDENTRIIRVQ